MKKDDSKKIFSFFTLQNIRMKFTLFIGGVVFIVVSLMSFMILYMVGNYQQRIHENHLNDQREFMVTLMQREYKVYNLLKNQKNLDEFVKIYSNSLLDELDNVNSAKLLVKDSVQNQFGNMEDFNKETQLFKTLDKDISTYTIHKDSIIYTTRLMLENNLYVDVLLEYDIKDSNAFYFALKEYLKYISILTFVISFVLSFLYFSHFAKLIEKLKYDVDEISHGRYDVVPIEGRFDEVGELSLGICRMSSKIVEHISDLKKEKEKQGKFFSGVSHEFKTPLTAINANVDLLSFYNDDEQMRLKAIDNIKKDSNRLYEMITSILEISKNSKSDIEINMESINISNVLLDIIERLRAKALKHEIEIEKSLPDTFVWADKKVLFHVFFNLIDNAIKYNKKNGKIFISIFVDAKNVKVHIRDTGIGIPEEYKDEVFEPFFTVDENNSTNIGGTGLGLAIVREKLLDIGASISIVQSNDQGTCFEVCLGVRE